MGMVQKPALDALRDFDRRHHRAERAPQVMAVEPLHSDLLAQIVEQVGRIHVVPRLRKLATRWEHELPGLGAKPTANRLVRRHRLPAFEQLQRHWWDGHPVVAAILGLVEEDVWPPVWMLFQPDVACGAPADSRAADLRQKLAPH